MNRQKYALVVLAGVVMLVAGPSAGSGCAEARAAKRRTGRRASARGSTRLVSAVRGDAPMAYTSPIVKTAKIGGKDFIVTTMQVKNLATGAIAGLRVEEFWYNKAGDAGHGRRLPPSEADCSPDEIITVTLETPRNAGMDSNQLKFQHANGGITMTKVAKF